MCVCGDMILKERKSKVIYGFGRVWCYFQYVDIRVPVPGNGVLKL